MWFKKTIKIFNYSKLAAYGLLILVILLFLVYLLDENHSNVVWEVIDPVAGIMTFITTLVIFGFQAKKNWEDSLEKMLSVEYIYTGEEQDLLIAKIENAYLSGESDVRQWAQSLGQQIMGNLDFDMNWDESPRKIIYNDSEKSFYKNFEVKLYLTTNPISIPNDPRKGEQAIKAFLNRKFKYSKIEGDLTQLPIKWIRK
ncbi:MAG: hypothetical protein M9958_13145 [Chitinophagales bacterium]|nr:hypothetical protein [Chitinophagales bacterium]